MAIGVWPITAMFFDGRGHNNKTGQESFFSLAHLFLYAGLTVLGHLDRRARDALSGRCSTRKTLMPDLQG